jgi:hypothetical protein
MPPFPILVAWYLIKSTVTTLLILAVALACNSRGQEVWCTSFCQTGELFLPITSSLIRSTAEEEWVRNQNTMKVTSNVLKEA